MFKEFVVWVVARRVRPWLEYQDWLTNCDRHQSLLWSIESPQASSEPLQEIESLQPTNMDLEEEIDSVLYIAREVSGLDLNHNTLWIQLTGIHGSVYKIPPLNANEGYRANDWGDLSLPLWKGRLRITQNSKGATIHLEDSQMVKFSKAFYLLKVSANAIVIQENVRHLVYILLGLDKQ